MIGDGLWGLIKEEKCGGYRWIICELDGAPFVGHFSPMLSIPALFLSQTHCLSISLSRKPSIAPSTPSLVLKSDSNVCEQYEETVEELQCCKRFIYLSYIWFFWFESSIFHLMLDFALIWSDFGFRYVRLVFFWSYQIQAIIYEIRLHAFWCLSFFEVPIYIKRSKSMHTRRHFENP